MQPHRSIKTSELQQNIETKIPSQIRDDVRFLLSKYADKKAGVIPVIKYLEKRTRAEITAFLNDGSPFDNIKFFVGTQPGYKNTFVEAQARHYQISVNSVSAYNSLVNHINNPKNTPEDTYRYFEILDIPEIDKEQLRVRLEAKIGKSAIEPSANDTPENQAKIVYNEDVRGTATDTQVLASSPVHSPKDYPDYVGLVEPRLFNMALDIGQDIEAQLWFILRHVDKLENGLPKGHISTEAIRSWAANKNYSQSKFYDILNSGHGIWWTYDRNHERVFYRKPEDMAIYFADTLPENRLIHYTLTNAIGKPAYIDLTGTIGQFRARVFGGWIEQRKRPNKPFTMANETMALIWGVCERTIRRWKRAARVTGTNNYTVLAAKENSHQIRPDTPDHALSTSKGLAYWQISSSYNTEAEIHHRRGRSRKARTVFYRQLARRSYSPDSKAHVGEQYEQQRYFVDTDTTKAFLKADSVLRKSKQDTYLPRYIFIAEKQDNGLWETFSDTRQRTRLEYAQ